MTAIVAKRILAEGSGVGCMPFSYKGVFEGSTVDLPDCEEDVEASNILRKVRYLLTGQGDVPGDDCGVKCT